MTVLYGAQSDQLMFTNFRGKHQILEGGNLLITEPEAGRVIEVDPAGNIVWEFINRFDDDEVLPVSQANRYSEDYFSVTDWSCD